MIITHNNDEARERCEADREFQPFEEVEQKEKVCLSCRWVQSQCHCEADYYHALENWKKAVFKHLDNLSI
jgi:hypothetical protein